MPRKGHVNISIPATLAKIIEQYIKDHEEELKLEYGRVGISTIARIAIIEYLKNRGVNIKSQK